MQRSAHTIMKKFWYYNETVILLIISLVLYKITSCFGLNANISEILKDSLRITLYATLSQIMGALLGIGIAGLTILLTMEKSTSMKILKNSPYYNELFDIFLISIKKYAVGTVCCILMLIVDSNSEPKLYCFYFTVYWCVNCSISLYRCIWVLKNVIKIQI